MPRHRTHHEPGERFGLVTFVRFAPSIRVARAVVRCDCGVERVVVCHQLRRSPPKSHRACRAAARQVAL